VDEISEEGESEDIFALCGFADQAENNVGSPIDDDVM